MHAFTWRTRSIAVIFGSAILLSTANVQAQKLLRWQFQPGDVMNVNFTQDMTVQMKSMGHDVESSADMGMTMRWTVEAVDADGTANIRQSIDRLAMRLETPGTDPIEYDSAQTEPATGTAAMLATSVDPMVGIEMTQQMTAAGDILNVQLSEKAKQQLDEAPAGAQLKDVLSNDGLRALLSQAATVFPNRPLSPGDTWPGVTESQSPVGKLKMEMEYTYHGTELYAGRPVERIDVEMVVTFPPGANPNGMNITVRNQKNTGTLLFDAELGRFVTTELNQNMRLVTSIAGQEHAQIMSTILRMNFEPTSQVAQASATESTAPQSKVQPATFTR